MEKGWTNDDKFRLYLLFNLKFVVWSYSLKQKSSLCLPLIATKLTLYLYSFHISSFLPFFLCLISAFGLQMFVSP